MLFRDQDGRTRGARSVDARERSDLVQRGDRPGPTATQARPPRTRSVTIFGRIWTLNRAERQSPKLAQVGATVRLAASEVFRRGMCVGKARLRDRWCCIEPG